MNTIRTHISSTDRTRATGTILRGDLTLAKGATAPNAKVPLIVTFSPVTDEKTGKLYYQSKVEWDWMTAQLLSDCASNSYCSWGAAISSLVKKLIKVDCKLTSSKVTCTAFSKEAMTPGEFGTALKSKPEIVEKLREIFGIRIGTPFTAGQDYNKVTLEAAANALRSLSE